jgi:NADH-quinone oxidoreductase subunit L/multicomponent Na+:H+ antiporter subunit D
MSDVQTLLPVAAVAVSLLAIPPMVLFRRRQNLREGVTMAAALAKFAIVASFLPGVIAGQAYVADLGIGFAGVRFALRVDALGLLFGLLASLLWIVTSLYSIGYVRGLAEHAQTRYFAAFAASLAAAVGVAFAANLLTLFVFYELLTVATYPLVAHDETAEARAAGRKYLAYTFGGGVAVLAGTALVFWLTGTTTFAAGGIEGLGTADPALARGAFVLLAGGFGVKAALMPVHSWLPDAMVAPTPVSGLLHAVAVVKSGVFGIARVVLEVFGPDAVAELGMGLPLAIVAAVTLLTASVIALGKDNLKRRLAYSTISQLSYIVLGLALLGPSTIVGGLLHIPAHAFMKLTLFFCAGAIHVETHTDDISNMAGIGRRMPLTMAAFAVAAAGMAGIPLIAGFVSKWYILIGAVELGEAVFAVALLLSGLLNVAYFWPIVYQAFFETPEDHDPKPLVDGPLGGSEGVRADGGAEHVDDGGTHDAEDPDDAPDDPGTEVETRVSDEAHGAHEGHDGGPAPGGWETAGWRGDESTWFMLGPILATALGSVFLGVAPSVFVFLEIVTEVVATLPGVAL